MLPEYAVAGRYLESNFRSFELEDKACSKMSQCTLVLQPVGNILPKYQGSSVYQGAQCSSDTYFNEFRGVYMEVSRSNRRFIVCTISFERLEASP